MCQTRDMQEGSGQGLVVHLQVLEDADHRKGAVQQGFCYPTGLSTGLAQQGQRQSLALQLQPLKPKLDRLGREPLGLWKM